MLSLSIHGNSLPYSHYGGGDGGLLGRTSSNSEYGTALHPSNLLWAHVMMPCRPKLLYTIPVHNNPRGTTLPPHRRQHLVRLAHQYGFHIIADEVYQVGASRQLLH